MELRQLKYFEKACELKNFSEASRMLHISQSTLSQQIKQLEDELNVLLFDRIGKRIIPTEAGMAFLPFARNSILEAENGKQIIKDLKGIMTGTLNIGVTYSLSHLLRCSITDFKKVYPGINVIINFGTSKEQIRLLENKHVDCVLSFEPEEIDEEYEKIKLFSSKLYFIVHESHPMSYLSSISLKKTTGNRLDFTGCRICHSHENRRGVQQEQPQTKYGNGNKRCADYNTSNKKRKLGNYTDQSSNKRRT